ncbi:hypothetical protein D1872_266140 [compost metagenome]
MAFRHFNRYAGLQSFIGCRNYRRSGADAGNISKRVNFGNARVLRIVARGIGYIRYRSVGVNRLNDAMHGLSDGQMKLIRLKLELG